MFVWGNSQSISVLPTEEAIKLACKEIVSFSLAHLGVCHQEGFSRGGQPLISRPRTWRELAISQFSKFPEPNEPCSGSHLETKSGLGTTSSVAQAFKNLGEKREGSLERPELHTVLPSSRSGKLERNLGSSP